MQTGGSSCPVSPPRAHRSGTGTLKTSVVIADIEAHPDKYVKVKFSLFK
jgi:hypothetical protein